MTQSEFWQGKKVLVTGGAGFIGSHVVEKLVGRGATVTVLDTLENGSKKNLEPVADSITLIVASASILDEARAAAEGQDVVMNLAARVGGIEYNRTHQATMMRDNLLIGTVMLEAARQAGVPRFLAVSSACVYPRDASIPTPESEGFRGEPEPTNGGYGWAKRMAETLARYYAEEFGMQVSIVRPYNAYGPRDHFEPDVSHVIPALIRRVMNEENPLIVWGSGRATRAFLYVEDLAEGMILAVERQPGPEPINVGIDEEITITDLTTLILKVTGKDLEVQFDATKPDGSPRRNSDNTKATQLLGFRPNISLPEGLQKTIDWYRHEGA